MKALIDAEEDFRKATGTFGRSFVFQMATEEIGEFLVSYTHWERGKGPKEDILEEAADAMITITNVALIHHTMDDLEKMIELKLHKMKKAIAKSLETRTLV